MRILRKLLFGLCVCTGDNPRVDYRPYICTNHTTCISFLLHQHAFALVHCEIFYVKHFYITKRFNNDFKPIKSFSAIMSREFQIFIFAWIFAKV